MAASVRPARLLLLGPAGGLGRGGRAYRAPPPPRRPPGPYWPDPEAPLTPRWQLGPRHAAKQFGRHGAASGVDPGALWPGRAQLLELQAEEDEGCPSLARMQESLREKQLAEEQQRREREQHIAECMAKMPQMIADWRRQKRERWEKAQADKERRARLQAEAQERLGYHVDPRSARFQELLQDLEKQQRKRLKEEKLRLKKEARAAALAAAPTPAASQDATAPTPASQDPVAPQ